MAWILLTLFYAVSKGARELIKKAALRKSSVIEVLFVYTLLSTLICLPHTGEAMKMDMSLLPIIAVKSFIIFIAWFVSFIAIKRMPVSVYGVIDLSRVLFSTVLSVVFLHETMGIFEIGGFVLVLAGLFMLARMKKDVGDGEHERTEAKYVIFTLISCLFNAISGVLDKVLMKSVTSVQLQYWYMLFLTGYYLIYVIVTRTKFDIRGIVKNYYIPLLAVVFVVADRALFMANGYPDSSVTVMTLIKQAGCVVVIVGGKLFFKEKHTLYKLACAGVVIAGIVLACIG